MKTRDPSEVVNDQLRLDGNLAAVRVLVERHRAFASAADLMRLFAPDAPGFLISALYQPGTREALIRLSATLDSLGRRDDTADEPMPAISLERHTGHPLDTPLGKLWRRLHVAGADVQREAERRVETLMSIERLTDCGRTLAEAVILVSAATDVPALTIMDWRAAVKGVPCADWFPHLAFVGNGDAEAAAA